MTTKDLGDLNERIEKRAASFASTDDKRTGQSTVRHQYRTLSDAEKEQMSGLKDLGQAFIDKLYEISGTEVGSERFASRDLSLANTHAEDAVMRAVRHVTK